MELNVVYFTIVDIYILILHYMNVHVFFLRILWNNYIYFQMYFVLLLCVYMLSNNVWIVNSNV